MEVKTPSLASIRGAHHSDEDDEDEEDEEPELPEPTHGGVPPGLKQVPPQRLRRRRASRVSICVAKCRSSRLAVEAALARLQWEQVSRDTPEVSVSWLEHTDSTAMVSPFQVMSKIEGILQVCRKADLAACLQAMQERFPVEYDFVPRTWILSCLLPDQVVDLEKTMAEKKGWTYICKPTSGSQGRGLRLVRTFAELRGPVRDAFPRGAERLRPAEYVVQRYLTKPLLVDGYKFDCRCYVIVTGIVPLRAYLFQEGLARFCTTKYEKPRGRNLGNSCMHLTNYAVNKHSDAFSCVRAHDAGSKRSLSSVFALIQAQGGPPAEALWQEIAGVAEKTILAVRPALVEHMAHGEHGAFHPAGPKGFHILGFDILFDERYQPTLLELNANSSLSVLQPAAEPSETGSKNEVSELDAAVKAELLTQALLVANPLPHRLALQGRISWFEAVNAARGGQRCQMHVCPLVDEPIPLDDSGNLVHESAALTAPRLDQPSKCPALQLLDFERHKAFVHVQNQLLAYRIWRHFAFNPPGSCALKEGQSRRYLGFGRAQFRQLCDAAGLVDDCPRSLGEEGFPLAAPCWPDRATAELFFSYLGAEEAAGGNVVLDFSRFLRCLALPVGEALMSDLTDTTDMAFMPDPLEVFVSRVFARASSSHGLRSSPDCEGSRQYSDEDECEESL